MLSNCHIAGSSIGNLNFFGIVNFHMIPQLPPLVVSSETSTVTVEASSLL